MQDSEHSRFSNMSFIYYVDSGGNIGVL